MAEASVIDNVSADICREDMDSDVLVAADIQDGHGYKIRSGDKTHDGDGASGWGAKARSY